MSKHKGRNRFGTFVLVFLFASVFILFSTSSTLAATCYGSPNCRACKTCNYCGHCNSGGSPCGVFYGNRGLAKPRQKKSVKHVISKPLNSKFNSEVENSIVTRRSRQLPNAIGSGTYSRKIASPYYFVPSPSFKKANHPKRLESARRTFVQYRESGKYLELSDGSLWESPISISDAERTWMPEDQILIIESNILVNLTRKDEVLLVNKIFTYENEAVKSK